MDEIKIDRCFVTGIQNSAYNYRLLNNILELAGGNQVRTCCEGVETIEELNVLNGLHCSLMQGYLFSPPARPQNLSAGLLPPDPMPCPIPCICPACRKPPPSCLPLRWKTPWRRPS